MGVKMKKAFVPLIFSLVLQSCVSYTKISSQEYDHLVEVARLFAYQIMLHTINHNFGNPWAGIII